MPKQYEMKIARRALVATAAVIAALLLATTAYVLIAVQREHTSRENLGRFAPRIEKSGIALRDLNKNGKIDPYEDPSTDLEARVDDLMARMQTAEKVGLMLRPSILPGHDGRLLDAWSGVFAQGMGTLEAIVGRHIRHFRVDDAIAPAAMARWQNRVQEVAERTRLGIPVTLSSNPRHHLGQPTPGNTHDSGKFSRWPAPLGLAATRNAALVEKFGKIANQEYRAVGLRNTLSPVADLATEPRWARIANTFGEDASLAATMVRAYIRGFQGITPGPESVLCMTKHFPGAGPQNEGLDSHFSYGGEQAYPGDNFAYHLIPFEAALQAGTAQMMPQYAIATGQTEEEVAAGFNHELITGLLRDRYGFDGVVCTNWESITPRSMGPIEILHSRSFGVEELSIPERFEKALDAGVDQFGGEDDPAPLIGLVDSGKVENERLDRSVRRILRDKFRLGLFDNPYVDAEAADALCGKPEFRAAGLDAQRKSIVLLQNTRIDEQTVLPLGRQQRIYLEGFDPAIAARYATVVATKEEAEVILARVRTPWVEQSPGTLGDWLLNSRFHQGGLEFQSAEREHLMEMARDKPTVLAVLLDRPAILSEVTQVTAGMVAHFGASDEALLDVIFGRFAPTGKLPLELPSSMDAVREQREDVPYDSAEPLFPFGFGLSYERRQEG